MHGSLLAVLVVSVLLAALARRFDVSAPLAPTLTLELQRDDLSLSFLGTVTVFSAPQEVALEELRIESFFPLDERTAAACAQLGDAT